MNGGTQNPLIPLHVVDGMEENQEYCLFIGGPMVDGSLDLEVNLERKVQE